jgi:hypothetical protein
MRSSSTSSATRLLTGLLSFAVAASIVHYTDNYLNYDAYPQSSSVPNPSAIIVLLSWFVFTSFGIAGYVLFCRGDITRACLCLAAYSGSGLVGIGHYTVPGATDLVWWRQLHIITDIFCGVAIFAFAVWAARAAPKQA